ncbi:L,D-transpeptidase [Sphingomonas parva]|uniref:L,D-transpeptidase n=1 Tax=Sphingomonas parva TaxID=2555898 RepID=A0A4Y8ZN03_9SPHN|nr:L,D-transpeptidase family protein [Sphingomonas parva]TFI57388.1 L,D-transpeptidase [Sphingomonas parva]
MYRRITLPLVLLSTAAASHAQNAVPAPAPVQAPVAATPTVQAAPAPVVAAEWKRKQAQELLAYVEAIGEEGLDPADYNPERLRQAIDAKDERLSAVATETFLKVASDLMFGHVRGAARIDWYVEDDSWNVYDQQALLDRAVAGETVGDALRSLLPTHPQYAALKTALVKAQDEGSRGKIRTNLDRWRWLPRDLGQKYVIVNVPAYTVALVESGVTLDRRRAVAGAIKTPTPSLNATITGAIFNPWWEVPSSIAREVAGKKGYVSVKSAGGAVRYRQPPGPSNALGKVKLVMGNPHAIYLHDTNAKNLFNKQARAYSHGCIRTEDAVGFAATLLDGTEWSRDKVNETVKSGKTVQANVATPIPVYIVYFTVAGTDEGDLKRYDDMYSRDTKVLAALDDRGTALASN